MTSVLVFEGGRHKVRACPRAQPQPTTLPGRAIYQRLKYSIHPSIYHLFDLVHTIDIDINSCSSNYLIEYSTLSTKLFADTMGVYQHARTSENDPMLSIAVDASSSTDSLSELDYESQLFSEKQPKPKHPARTRTRTRTLQWSAFLTCCVITVVLVVLILQYPTPPSSNDSSEGHNEATPSIQGGGLVNSTELDLKTNFLISNVPTTRSYTFDITQGFAAPDGFRKSMLLINGHSPGPLIEANTGDRIRVVVNNQLANQSTTMHWHGIDQENSVWMDGVQGVTQCGIPPGQSFTYDFTVSDQRGTFWYHSHSEVQYTDGLYGPMVSHV